jgi:hypothetical protein
VILVALLLQGGEVRYILHSSPARSSLVKLGLRTKAIREQPLRGLSTTGSPVPIQFTGVDLASLPHRAGCTYLQTRGDELVLVVTGLSFRTVDIPQFKQLDREVFACGFVLPLFVSDTAPPKGGSVQVSSLSHLLLPAR